MKIKRGLAKFSSFFESAMVVLISSLFVMSIVFAATTIGSNISTDGNLDVNGTSSTTSATSTAYIDIGVRPDGATTLVNWTGGDLYVQDDLEVDDDVNIADLLTLGRATTTSATSTKFIHIGAFPATAATLVNWDGGDLYVQDDLEVDDDANFADDVTIVDLLTSGRETTTSATSTAYLWVGYPLANPTGFDYSQDLAVADDVLIGGQSTSTVSLWIGLAGTVNNLNLAGGDLYVQDGLEVDGGTWLNNATTTDSLKIGGYASTTGDLFVGGGTIDTTTSTLATTSVGVYLRARHGLSGTTTLSIGDTDGDDIKGCIEMVRGDGTWARAVIDGTVWSIGNGRCND
ncbi:MAG TPA: hypothetical protein VJG65_03410 [Patescibacteria group bacterium]|nr:hypothetical protein [Patescibacteria group bacterium]